MNYLKKSTIVYKSINPIHHSPNFLVTQITLLPNSHLRWRDLYMKKITRLISYLIFILILTSQCTKKKDLAQMVADFFTKNKDVTILVTDSGLGGLSVAADVAARLSQSGVFENARIVFFNSLFHNRSGYNSLKSEDEKVRIFNIALKSMNKKYHPDLLLIACNTLSVLYDKTPFSNRVKFPVIGIVETGVDLIAKQFDQNPEATAIIFATRTTIGSNAHKNLLVSRGYPENQIIGQACHRLAGSIERGYDSEETIGYIKQYVTEALKKIDNPDAPIFASLNCTHYGFSMKQFKNEFAQAGYPEIVIIDPNPEMSDFLFKPPYINRYPETNVTVEVISKTKISEREIKSLAKLLQQVSPTTATAYENYQYNPELFDAKFDSTTIGK
jgi:glutamate racemase